jgi:hypothetical protein
MSPIGLLRVAAEAEGLRLRHTVQRSVTRLVAGVIGLVFLLGALAFAHVAIWFWLRIDLQWIQYATAGALAGLDLLIALICVFMAARSGPGRIEVEALAIRRQALANVTQTAATATVVIPVVRTVIGMLRSRR